MYSNGFSKQRAITIANGYSELLLQAYSTGDISPILKSPTLLINAKFVTRLESSGLNNLPSPSTGI